ncbi:3-keto-5-aminohexanoate cleavage protein [Aquabacterium sp.]|uniref:3-keto-5-aminohexanoate cleavage protein n=1 Tax=Aquabacterium sp. TaxID=1872578 RepID=UPI00248878CB|nr:3-keto-5-aminohexanoate cleavage protein [Aquabacterium sp.]MDI1257783.1 3-keto-5-aminohexanoate cleavage protein [Aquabacterium sp.]
MMDKAILTCALTGVLTDPAQHPVPVTASEMAAAAREAYDAGASIMHVHLRQQTPGMGRFPSWDPEVAAEIDTAIRAACPGVIINLTTGVMGPDISGPVACIRRVRPEIAACNAGSLNYLKIKENGQWAWPPMLFDNTVDKIKGMLDVMHETHTRPEFECFDVGIVRSVGMFRKAGMTEHLEYNFVMGVASGMPVDAELLALLVKYREPDTVWQTTLIGREEIWAVHQATADLGGMLRTGVEDTFYLPGGERTSGNGPLIEALAACAKRAGREVASPQEARAMLGLRAQALHGALAP